MIQNELNRIIDDLTGRIENHLRGSGLACVIVLMDPRDGTAIHSSDIEQPDLARALRNLVDSMDAENARAAQPAVAGKVRLIE